MEAFASLPLDSPFFRTGLSSEAPVQAPPSAMPLSATPPPLSGFASPDAALQPQSMPTFPMPASEPLPERRFAQEPRQSAKWTEDEDAALKAAVEVNGPKSWKKVSQVVGTRSSVQCLQRWNKVLKPGLKKGPWVKDEDQKLLEAIKRLHPPDSGDAELSKEKPINWSKAAASVPGRTPKQCRERWRCNLDPSISKASWRPEEDNLILELQGQMGNSWALFTARLPGRTENAIKTRFRTLERMRSEATRTPTDSAAAPPKPRITKRLKSTTATAAAASPEDAPFPGATPPPPPMSQNGALLDSPALSMLPITPPFTGSF